MSDNIIPEGKLCDYGCGLEAKILFGNGKWCCSKSHNSCSQLIKRNPTCGGQKKKKRTQKEKSLLCDYGCGQESKFYLKTVNKWCCSKSWNSCIKLRELKTGRKRSEETRNKMKKPLSLSHKIKIGEGNKNKIRSEKFKENLRKPLPEETKNKLRGRSSWNIGLTKETDLRVKNLSEKVHTEENRKIRKEKMLNGFSKFMNTINQVERFKKKRKTMEESGKWTKIEELKDLKLYNYLVWKYTNISSKNKFTKEQLKQRGMKKGNKDKNLDHVFSIHEGFKLGILPQIIGSKSNIDLVCCEYNHKKRNKCDITKENLFRRYEEEETKNLLKRN